MTPRATPMPMPAAAPVERLEEDLEGASAGRVELSGEAEVVEEVLDEVVVVDAEVAVDDGLCEAC